MKWSTVVFPMQSRKSGSSSGSESGSDLSQRGTQTRSCWEYSAVFNDFPRQLRYRLMYYITNKLCHFKQNHFYCTGTRSVFLFLKARSVPYLMKIPDLEKSFWSSLIRIRIHRTVPMLFIFQNIKSHGGRSHTHKSQNSDYRLVSYSCRYIFFRLNTKFHLHFKRTVLYLFVSICLLRNYFLRKS